MVFRALKMTGEQEVRVGRFVVKEKLGQGGMGSVYRAFDPQLERDVALKVLEGTVDAEHAEAVRKEARALARLAHPHVVAVYELGIENNQVFVAMEYVPGQTVQAYAEALDDRDPETLLRLFIQAGRGLQAAHEAGLVHRDVKPDNLLVREDGRVLIADFGLACMAGSLPIGEVAGTPPFMAPEVIQGEASTHSDQFAFCASLWRLLDDEAPLRSPSARMPTPIREVLSRGLAPAPEERWPSMRELLTALSGCLKRGPNAHHRQVLLDRVDRLWIRGVLHTSLSAGPVLALPVSNTAAQVDAPLGVQAQRITSSTLLSHVEAGQGSLLVLGEPGAGKTTTLLQLAEAMLDEARLDSSAPVPVVLLLASLADHRGAIEAWIEQELVAKYGLPRSNVGRWIDDGTLALLLDGLDEVAAGKQARCIEALNGFRRTQGLSMIVTCRTSDYEHIGSRLGFGHAVTIDPIPTDLITEYFASDDQAETLDASLRTPLFLGLLARCEGPLPGAGERLPWMYERYLDHAFEAHPERREQLLGGLEFLAAAMTRSDRSELWIEQLEPDWLFDDARRHLAKALGVLMLVAVCLAVNITVGYAAEGDMMSGLLFGLCSVPMILILNGGLTIRPVERLRFSWSRLVRLAPVSIGVGILGGAVYGMFYILWANIVFGAVAGLVTVVTMAFEPSLQETGVRPNQGIRQSLINGLAIGTIGFVLGGVTLGYIAVPLVLPYLEPPSTLVDLPHPERSAAAVAGSLLGVIAGTVRGGWAVLMHTALRVVLATTTPLPLRLVPFLDQAADLALMRRVGGGYIFLHRTFQSFLGSRTSSLS